MATGFVLVSALSLAIGLLIMLRYVRPTLHLDPRLCWTVLLGGLPFFVWQAALLIYGQIDTVLLSLLSTEAVIGWYAAAYGSS